MSLPDPNKLSDAVRRGELTAAQEAELNAYLLDHPGERAAWEEDLSLTHFLGELPSAPLSSNFTSQVMQSVRNEQQSRASAAKVPWWRWLSGSWLPKLAATTAALALSWFAYHHHRVAVRQEIARTMLEMDMLTTGAPLDILRNFEAIQRLDQVPQDADRELFAALQ